MSDERKRMKMNCSYCDVTKGYPENFPIPGHAKCVGCIEGRARVRIKNTKEKLYLRESQDEQGIK